MNLPNPCYFKKTSAGYWFHKGSMCGSARKKVLRETQGREFPDIQGMKMELRLLPQWQIMEFSDNKKIFVTVIMALFNKTNSIIFKFYVLITYYLREIISYSLNEMFITFLKMVYCFRYSSKTAFEESSMKILQNIRL